MVRSGIIVSTIQCNSLSNDSVLFFYTQLRDSSSQLLDCGVNVDHCMKFKDGTSLLGQEGRGFCPFYSFLKVQFL